MSALLELAERCEKAEGPDRELDADIAVIVFGHERDGNDLWHSGERSTISETDYYELAGQVRELPSWSASLDAALTLVPEGHHWQAGNGVETEFGNRDCCYAWCSPEDTGVLSFAATPALALCAAALRALAASDASASAQPAQASGGDAARPGDAG